MSGPVLRYDVRGPTGAPTLTRTIDDPSFFRPCCFAFTPAGELLVVNRGDPLASQSGYISRIRDPLFSTPSNVVIDIQFAPRPACDHVAAGGANDCG